MKETPRKHAKKPKKQPKQKLTTKDPVRPGFFNRVIVKGWQP